MPGPARDSFFKFRDFKSPCFTYDILTKDRLFLSDWKKQNDAVEGHYFADNLRKEQIDDIYVHKTANKICSLSRGFRHPLMWGHYADGCKGIAIELGIEQPGPDDRYSLHRVKYEQKLDVRVNENEAGQIGREELAKRILTSKTRAWSYESETRILSLDASAKYFTKLKIRSVIIGHRIESSNWMKLKTICGLRGIPMYRIEFCGKGIGLEQEDL